MNEAETRAEHIDPALRAAGWGVVEGSRVLREYRITLGRLEGNGQRAKPEIADYVLVHRNTKLAVIEAKAWDKPYTEGVGQAKQYAAKLALRFAYATNGQKIYAMDVAVGAEGDVAAFPGPDELWARTFAAANAWRDRFAAVPFPDKSGSWQIRFYQEIAVNRVLEAIAEGQDRLLLTLATGTGKTSIAFQIAWKLFQARWNLSERGGDSAPTRRPRILFLADRNNLANQAYNDFTAFAAFEDDALARIKPEEIRKQGRVPKSRSIFFTIFQTFMSGPPKDSEPSPYFGEYPPDFFDFIVIDECHRGGARDESSWREILQYFAPAVQLGLTATPKRRNNADTYAYFGEPLYSYSLKEGINDGFLTPFKVKQFATTIDDYTYTPDDAVIEGEVVPGKRYVESEFNRAIVIPEREAYRVGKFMDLIDQREKTLVFCATQEHALMVRDLINQTSKSTDPLYCVRVTADEGERGNEYLRNFQDNEKTIPTPEFFKDEDQLREIWSDPATRKALLDGLAGKGFGHAALAEMQKAIEAENSDLFDVLAYVAFTRAPLTRDERVVLAKSGINVTYKNNRQLAFLDFVLGHYVDQGVAELGLDKLPPLLRLKYHDISDAAAALGDPEQIRNLFVDFQKYLYQDSRQESGSTSVF